MAQTETLKLMHKINRGDDTGAYAIERELNESALCAGKKIEFEVTGRSLLTVDARHMDSEILFGILDTLEKPVGITHVETGDLMVVLVPNTMKVRGKQPSPQYKGFLKVEDEAAGEAKAGITLEKLAAVLRKPVQSLKNIHPALCAQVVDTGGENVLCLAVSPEVYARYAPKSFSKLGLETPLTEAMTTLKELRANFDRGGNIRNVPVETAAAAPAAPKEIFVPIESITGAEATAKEPTHNEKLASTFIRMAELGLHTNFTSSLQTPAGTVHVSMDPEEIAATRAHVALLTAENDADVDPALKKAFEIVALSGNDVLLVLRAHFGDVNVLVINPEPGAAAATPAPTK